jgi:mono/diheme cytochrome c family protein
MRQIVTFISLSVMALLVSGCPFGKSSKTQNNTEQESPEAKLIARGKAVYVSNCTSCHSSNPKLPGSLGPDVYGSSKELLTARLLHAKYPDGYTPKRSSNAMPAMPHLANDIDALAAYLNQP